MSASSTPPPPPPPLPPPPNQQQQHPSPVLSLSSVNGPSSSLTPVDSSLTTSSNNRRRRRRRNNNNNNNSLQGLSKFHQSILSRTVDRQRFVTGKYPLTVTVSENPTRKWLSRSSSFGSETEILVNGTLPLRSLASLDRFQWLDDWEREQLVEHYNMVSLELVAEIHLERPGYLQILPRNGAGSTARMARLEQQQQSSISWTNRWKKKPPSTEASSSWKDLTDIITTQEVDEGDRLWVTGFSLAGRRGMLRSLDSSASSSSSPLSGVDRSDHDSSCIVSVNSRTASSLLWPNEVSAVPASLFSNTNPHHHHNSATTTTAACCSHYQDALLVCDGFLVPGKDRGGLYVVKNPGNPQTEWTLRLTTHAAAADRWFYHRATWVDLTGDGRLSILTARCRISTRLGNSYDKQPHVTSGIKKTGQLLWLECPKPFTIDPETGTPLESDGTVFDPFSSRHLPWEEHVLAEGPDVMFCVADMDETDDTVEVISSQFFAKRVVLHSIRRGITPEIVLQRTIDDRCGSAFGCILAELDGGASATMSSSSSSPVRRRVVDSGSTVATIQPGDSFSHLLVTSHECTYAAKDAASSHDTSNPSHNNNHVNGYSRSDGDGGSLFAYRVPASKGGWKTEAWKRTTIATGFKVNGQLSNMINPGAPGFVYAFYANKADIGSTRRPLLAVAGDCAESAYLFRPCNSNDSLERPNDDENFDRSAQYRLMLDLQCESTIGSIGIGYDDFRWVAQESGFAKLYVPCFEKDKILVLALGSGSEDDDGW